MDDNKQNTPAQDDALQPDKVVKGILNRLPQEMVIEMINHEFGKHYPPDAKFERLSTETQAKGSDGKMSTRYADYIVGIDDDRYAFEFQTSPDKSMAFRMFEYGVRDAIAHGREDIENGARLSFPEQRVYYLCDNENTPNEFTIEVKLPGKVTLIDDMTISYGVKTGRSRDYTPAQLVNESKIVLLAYKQLNYIGKLSDKNGQAFADEFGEIAVAIRQLSQNEAIPRIVCEEITRQAQKVAEEALKKATPQDRERIREQMEQSLSAHHIDPLWWSNDRVDERLDLGIQQEKQLASQGKQLASQGKLIEQLKAEKAAEIARLQAELAKRDIALAKQLETTHTVTGNLIKTNTLPGATVEDISKRTGLSVDMIVAYNNERAMKKAAAPKEDAPPMKPPAVKPEEPTQGTTVKKHHPKR